MIKEKEKWETPIIFVQRFMPNEYVAACWELACIQGKYGDDGMDHSGTCGSAANNVISDNNGKVTVTERSNDQGWLSCKITNKDSWTDVGTGTYVEWETYAANGDGRVWKHKGTAGGLYPGHPNRS